MGVRSSQQAQQASTRLRICAVQVPCPNSQNTCWGAGLRWRPQSVKRFEAPTEPTGETIPDPYEERRPALTAERQKARREEQDYAAVRRNVEEFLSPPRQAPARQKDMELE